MGSSMQAGNGLRSKIFRSWKLRAPDSPVSLHYASLPRESPGSLNPTRLPDVRHGHSPLFRQQEVATISDRPLLPGPFRQTQPYPLARFPFRSQPPFFSLIPFSAPTHVPSDRPGSGLPLSSPLYPGSFQAVILSIPLNSTVNLRK